MTLLEAVQVCLQYSGSFEVSSIFDTDESERTATLAKEVHSRIQSRIRDNQFSSRASTLESVIDPLSAPNYLRIPDDVQRVQESIIRYNVSDVATPQYRTLKCVSNQEFFDLVSRGTGDNYVLVTDPSGGATYNVRSDKDPEYYTTFDGEYVAFDSWNLSKETTLHEQKSLVVVNEADTFLIDDDFIIPLPDHLLPGFQDMLLNEYFENVLEEARPTVARRANAFIAKLQQDHRTMGGIQKPKRRYGRR